MALYSLSTKPISRSSGRSAVAAAAYRSGTELADERTGLVADYTRRSGVVHTEIVTRDGVPVPEREALWNQAEAAERRKDSRVAREYVVALPHELDADQRKALARELAVELSERYGVAVDLAVHAPDRDGDERNHHAHLLVTTRAYGHDGLGDKVRIEWSDKRLRKAGLGCGADEVKRLRQRWESLANAALERAKVAERVDCRSLKDQGIDRVPQIHVGPMGTEMQRRGTPELSNRASLNLEIQATNAELHQLQERAALRAAEREAQVARERVVAAVQADPAAAMRRYRDAWQERRDAVTAQAERLMSRCEQQRQQVGVSLAAERASEPAEPTGLGAVFKRRRYESEHAAWRERIDALEHRAAVLDRRVERLTGYADERQRWQLSPSVGDQLADARLATVQPDLIEAKEIAEPLAREQERRQSALEREKRIEKRQELDAAKRQQRQEQPAAEREHVPESIRAAVSDEPQQRHYLAVPPRELRIARDVDGVRWDRQRKQCYVTDSASPALERWPQQTAPEAPQRPRSIPPALRSMWGEDQPAEAQQEPQEPRPTNGWPAPGRGRGSDGPELG